MAVKDPALNGRIVQAATAEFLEFGFQDASLRRIAQRAGLSTGALYTRYSSKDDLFCSIISDVLKEINGEFEPMREIYMQAQSSGSAEMILSAIQQEQRVYMDLIFKYYDECVLMFCRSEGSSLQDRWQEFISYKAQETVAFFNRIAKHPINSDGIELLLSEQFHGYQWILQKGMSRERTLSCLQMVEAFHEAGWRDLLRQIL